MRSHGANGDGYSSGGYPNHDILENIFRKIKMEQGGSSSVVGRGSVWV